MRTNKKCTVAPSFYFKNKPETQIERQYVYQRLSDKIIFPKKTKKKFCVIWVDQNLTLETFLKNHLEHIVIKNSPTLRNNSTCVIIYQNFSNYGKKMTIKNIRYKNTRYFKIFFLV